MTLLRMAAVAAAVLSCAPMSAGAQENFPSRPIAIIVPFSAGSQPDVLARSIADGLTRLSGQAALVLNRDGAAGTIAVETVAKARPDGYTIGFGPPGQFLIQPHVRRNLGYRLDQFEFLCQTHSTSFVLATHQGSPYASLQQLLDAARSAPGKLNFGSGGHLIVPHLLTENLAVEAGVKFTHVPFKSVADLYVQAQNATLDFIATTPIALTGGRGLRGLAVMGERRLPTAPDVPTLAEAGFTSADIPGLAKLGVYGPKGMAAQHSAYLREACAKIVAMPQTLAVGEKIATPVEYADAPAYSAVLVRDHARVATLMNALGVKPE